MLYFAIIIALTTLAVAADAFIKKAGDKTSSTFIFLALAIFLYIISVFGWFFVLKKVKLANAGAMYCVLTVLLITIVSVFYFKENLSLKEILGIIFAIISIATLAKFA